MRHPERIVFGAAAAVLGVYLIFGVAANGEDREARLVEERARRVEAERAREHPALAPPEFRPVATEAIDAWDPPGEPARASDWAGSFLTRVRTSGKERTTVCVFPIRVLRLDASVEIGKVTLRWSFSDIANALVERRGSLPVEATSGSWSDTTVAPKSRYEYRVKPVHADRPGEWSDWIAITTPDIWRLSFGARDVAAGIVRVKVEKFAKGKWTVDAERNFRGGDALGGSGRTLVSVKEVPHSRTREWCSGTKHRQSEAARWRATEIRYLEDGREVLLRDPVPGWARDALCPADRAAKILQGFADALRLRF